MKHREPFDFYDCRPEGMTAYLRYNGYHFNKKMCDYAVSLMRKGDGASGGTEKIEFTDKEKIDELLTANGVVIENNLGYDYVYVYHQCIADFFGSSIPDEMHLAMFVKDVVDDADQADGFVFNRWYADTVRAGIPIEWEDMI